LITILQPYCVISLSLLQSSPFQSS